MIAGRKLLLSTPINIGNDMGEEGGRGRRRREGAIQVCGFSQRMEGLDTHFSDLLCVDMFESVNLCACVVFVCVRALVCVCGVVRVASGFQYVGVCLCAWLDFINMR